MSMTSSIRAIAVYLVAAASFVAVPAAAQRSGRPPEVTAEQGAAFTASLIERALAADCQAVEAMFDVHAIVSRGMGSAPLSGSERMSLEMSFWRLITMPNGGLVSQLCAGLDGGRLASRGRGRAGDVPVERLRVEFPSGGVAYVDLVLGRTRDRVVVVDAFLAAQDTWLSAQVRQSAVSIGGADTPFARSLDARGRLLARHYPTMMEANQAAAAADVARLDAVVDRLPAELASDPLVMQLRIACAQRAGDSTSYAAALEDYLRVHPTSVTANLFAIDAFFLRRDYDAAFESIGRVETAVGPDAYLDYLRAIARALVGRTEEAHRYARVAVEADPGIASAWATLLDLSVSLGRDADAMRAFLELERHRATPPRVHGDAAFARLRATPEYRRAYPESSAPEPTTAQPAPASAPPAVTEPSRQRRRRQ